MDGFNKVPRGLVCFDFESSKRLWRYLTAPFPDEVELLDIKGDGQSCFAFGSFAPCNESRMEDGTDDLHAYMYAISTKGEPLWRWQRESAPGFSRVHPLVADLNRDGKEELLAWGDNLELNHVKHSPEVGRVVQLGDHGNELHESHAGACVFSCMAVDLDGDGRKEIVCTDCRGRAHLLNSELTQPKVFPLVLPKYEYVDLRVIGTINPERGRKRRLVFSSFQQHQITTNNLAGSPRLPPDKFRRSEYTIFVTDLDFNRKASHALKQEFTEERSFDWEVKIADMDGDGSAEIVSLSDHVEILKWKR